MRLILSIMYYYDLLTFNVYSAQTIKRRNSQRKQTKKREEFQEQCIGCPQYTSLFTSSAFVHNCKIEDNPLF